MNLNFPKWVHICLLVAGAFLLFLAVGLYAHSRVLEHSRSWEPLILPISLSSGSIRTPELGVNLSGDYEIELQFEQVPGIKNLGCSVGNARFNPNGCAGHSDLIDIAWVLDSNGQATQTGSSDDNPSVDFINPIVERRIGRFTARKGQNYVLIVQVKRDASELNIARPKLVVRVPRPTSGDFGAGVALEKLVAAILLILGLILIAAGGFGLRRRVSGQVVRPPVHV
jgi:hypothetical protein